MKSPPPYHLYPSSPSRTAFPRAGFILPLVLMALGGLIFLTVSALSLSQTTQRSTLSRKEHYHLNLALSSAQADACSLLTSVTHRDSFITHQHQNSSGNAEYFLVSWFENGSWHHQPLYSGAERESIPSVGLLDGYVSHTNHYNPAATGNDVCSLTDLHALDSDPTVKHHFQAPRITISPSLSYSFWIEDLNGLLDYEALTYNDGDPTHPYETSLSDLAHLFPDSFPTPVSGLLTTEELGGRAELRIIDQRHLGLNTLSTGEEAEHEYPINYTQPFAQRLINHTGAAHAPAPPSHPLEALLGTPATPSYALTPTIITTEVTADYSTLKDYFTVGLPNTYERELVPHGHHYPNAGQTKANINSLIREGEEHLEETITSLAQLLKNIPGMKDNPTEYAQIGITVGTEDVSHSRYGGFPITEESYTKTLAANMLDYADADSRPSVNRELGAQSYRGIDAMPLLTEAARRYLISDLIREDEELITVVQVRNFIEIWNPTNQPISGYVKFHFLPDRDTHVVTLSGHSYPLPEETLYYWNGSVHLQPNEYKVLEVTTDNDGDFIGEAGLPGYPSYGFPSLSADATIPRAQSTFKNQCYLYWYSPHDSNEATSQAEPQHESDFLLTCGLNTPFTIESGEIRHEYGNNGRRLYVNTTAIGTPLYEGMTGDPRNTLYCRRTGDGIFHGHTGLNFRASSSFGGPNVYEINSNKRRLNIEARFPDAYYNNSFTGADPPGSDTGVNSEVYPGEYGYVHMDDPAGPKNQDFTTSYYQPFHEQGQPVEYHLPDESDLQKYIQPISNRGAYISLGELGAIYDPAQWQHLKRQTTHQNDATPDDTEDSQDFTITLTTDYAQYGQDLYAQTRRQSGAPTLSEFGGGVTLAIGSPEFNAFSPHADPGYRKGTGEGREGYESARLLDHFRVTETPLRSLKSRINLNTAPKKVLDALFSGFTHQSDLIMGAFTHQPSSSPSDTTSAYSVGLIESRGHAPYLCLSDIALARATTHIGGREEELYLWGEKAFYEHEPAGGLPFNIHHQIWNDEGREEAFRRLNDLFTTKSRTYRVHIRAEYHHGSRKRHAEKYLDVSIHPARHSSPEAPTHLSINPSLPQKLRILTSMEK